MAAPPRQGSSHSLPAPPQTEQLFTRFSASLLSAPSITGSTGHLDNQIQPAHSSFQKYQEILRLRTLATKLQKKIIADDLLYTALFELTPVCKAESLASS